MQNALVHIPDASSNLAMEIVSQMCPPYPRYHQIERIVVKNEAFTLVVFQGQEHSHQLAWVIDHWVCDCKDYKQMPATAKACEHTRSLDSEVGQKLGSLNNRINTMLVYGDVCD